MRMQNLYLCPLWSVSVYGKLSVTCLKYSPMLKAMTNGSLLRFGWCSNCHFGQKIELWKYRWKVRYALMHAGWNSTSQRRLLRVTEASSGQAGSSWSVEEACTKKKKREKMEYWGFFRLPHSIFTLLPMAHQVTGPPSRLSTLAFRSGWNKVVRSQEVQSACRILVEERRRQSLESLLVSTDPLVCVGEGIWQVAGVWIPGMPNIWPALHR